MVSVRFESIQCPTKSAHFWNRQLDVNNHVLRRLDLRECEMFALMEEEAEQKQQKERYMFSSRMDHGQVTCDACDVQRLQKVDVWVVDTHGQLYDRSLFRTGASDWL